MTDPYVLRRGDGSIAHEIDLTCRPGWRPYTYDSGQESMALWEFNMDESESLVLSAQLHLPRAKRGEDPTWQWSFSLEAVDITRDKHVTLFAYDPEPCMLPSLSAAQLFAETVAKRFFRRCTDCLNSSGKESL